MAWAGIIGIGIGDGWGGGGSAPSFVVGLRIGGAPLLLPIFGHFMRPCTARAAAEATYSNNLYSPNKWQTSI